MSTTATANQLNFVGSLIRERARQLHIDDVDAAVEALREQRITMDGASAMIDRLTKMPKDPPVAKPGDTRGDLRPNNYAGSCCLCGSWVAAKAGTFRRAASGGWDTLHLPGQCPTLAVDGAPNRKLSFGERVTEILDGLLDGFYAVPSVTGSNDLTFVRFATNKGVYDPAKKGQRYVRHIVGGNGELENVSIAWIEKVAAAVRHAGMEASAQLYGQNTSHCGRCNRQLTDEESRRLGIGPECRRKGL